MTRYSYTLILQKSLKTVGNRWKNKMPWTLNLSSVCLNKVSFKVTLHSVLTFKKDQHARRDSWDCILLVLWCFHFVTCYFLYRADMGFLLGPTPLQPHQIPPNRLWQNTFLTLAGEAPVEATDPLKSRAYRLLSAVVCSETMKSRTVKTNNITTGMIHWTTPVRLPSIFLHR